MLTNPLGINPNRIAALLVVTILAGWVGYLLGFTRVTPQAARENLLLKYADRTVGELNRGLSTLANCEYVRRVYPTMPPRIEHLGAVQFAYDPLNPLLQEAYAATDKRTHIITLMDSFFAEDARMRESILAHEVMHIITGYSHHSPLVEATDPIYITIRKCFGENY